MANVMCGIVNDVDMGEADDADNEQAERHRQDGLDNTEVFDGNRKVSGIGHEEPLLEVRFSRTWIRLRPLFFHFPGDIPAGEVKVGSARDVAATNLGACRRSEGAFVGVKKDLAIPGLRIQPQQRPERAAMHHAEAAVVIRFKGQGVDIVAPRCQVSTAVQAVCSGSMHAPIVPARPGPAEGTHATSGTIVPMSDSQPLGPAASPALSAMRCHMPYPPASLLMTSPNNSQRSPLNLLS